MSATRPPLSVGWRTPLWLPTLDPELVLTGNGMDRMQYPSATGPLEPGRYELRFQSLFDSGRAYVFPCDAAGQVNMDALSALARKNYLYARSVIGREFLFPAVTASPS